MRAYPISEVWIRGQIIAVEGISEDTWTLLGIYPDKDDADAACLLTNEFIAPVPFGVPFKELQDNPRACYPRRVGI